MPTATSSAVPHAPALTPAQAVRAVLIGLSVWLVAALFIRFTGPLGLFEGVARVVLYAATAPASWVLVWMIRRLAVLRPDQLVAAAAVASFPAVMCDGVALVAFPQLYGGPAPHLLPAAAWLLWGAGLIFVFALSGARRSG
jgi:hypothetical protein